MKELGISYSVPAISLNNHDSNNGFSDRCDFEDDARQGSESFQEMMRQNMPSVARIPSPKPHRRHHHHHHHHKSTSSSSRSPSLQRKNGSSGCSEPHLPVSSENQQLRYRSSSDSSINVKEHHHHHHPNYKKMERSLSPLYIQEVSERMKRNSLDKDDSFDDNGIELSFSSKESGEGAWRELVETELTKGSRIERVDDIVPSINDYVKDVKAIDNEHSITTISREVICTDENQSCFNKDIREGSNNVDEMDSGDRHNHKDNNSSGETLTKRRNEVIGEVQKNREVRTKKRRLKMIDQLLEQCADNFNTVERDIDLNFKRLYTALENRRKELIEEAKGTRDRKIESLKEAKQLCLSSNSNASNSVAKQQQSLAKIHESLLLNAGSDNDSDESSSSSRRNSIEQEICLQQNGIFEPWKASTKTQSPSNNSKNHLTTATDSNHRHQQLLGEGNSSEQSMRILEEGNTMFEFNDESMEILSSLGKLKESLSSPQFSFAKGLQYGIALVGETVRFEVHTRNTHNEIEFNSCDDIKCQIIGISGQVTDVSRQVSLQRSLSNGRFVSSMGSQSFLHKFYSYVFTPREQGKYEVRIAVNGVEMKNSPFAYSVYPKVNLTFDVKSPGERSEINLLKTSESPSDDKKMVLDSTDPFAEAMRASSKTQLSSSTSASRRQAMSSFRQNSEETDWLDGNWIVQKGDKSSILRSVNDVPSYIYAMPSVRGFCAWQIRVTSACDSIDLSVGVGTRSGIPDIDEHFSCDFNIKQQQNNKKSQFAMGGGGGVGKGGSMQVRRTSSFTRVSTTYNVLLSTHEGVVRVICEQHEQDKTVRINPATLEKFEFYPFISMIHRHEQCSRQVCPRPQVTLL